MFTSIVFFRLLLVVHHKYHHFVIAFLCKPLLVKTNTCMYSCACNYKLQMKLLCDHHGCNAFTTGTELSHNLQTKVSKEGIICVDSGRSNSALPLHTYLSCAISIARVWWWV